MPPNSAIEYQLVNAGRLDWGGGATVDVTAPAKRGGRDAYRFHPSDLRIPLETLREKYSADVFERFRQNAQGERIEFADGRTMTVWEWLGGEPGEQTWPRESGAPLSKRAMASRIRATARSIENEPNEVFVLLNRDGTERFPRHISGPTGGAVPKEWIGEMAGCTFVHNHPSGLSRFGFGTSFSPEDLISTARQDLARVVAASRRRTYTMEPGPGGWLKPATIQDAFQKHDARVQLYLRDRVARGLTPGWKAEAAGAHLVWRAVAKELGMRYTVERRR